MTALERYSVHEKSIRSIVKNLHDISMDPNVTADKIIPAIKHASACIDNRLPRIRSIISAQEKRITHYIKQQKNKPKAYVPLCPSTFGSSKAAKTLVDILNRYGDVHLCNRVCSIISTMINEIRAIDLHNPYARFATREMLTRAESKANTITQKDVQSFTLNVLNLTYTNLTK